MQIHKYHKNRKTALLTENGLPSNYIDKDNIIIRLNSLLHPMPDRG